MNFLLCMILMKKLFLFILLLMIVVVWLVIESLVNFIRRGNFKENVGGIYMLYVCVKGKRWMVFIIENS